MIIHTRKYLLHKSDRFHFQRAARDSAKCWSHSFFSLTNRSRIARTQHEDTQR